jgi:hypothetical protein
VDSHAHAAHHVSVSHSPGCQHNHFNSQSHHRSHAPLTLTSGCRLPPHRHNYYLPPPPPPTSHPHTRPHISIITTIPPALEGTQHLLCPPVQPSRHTSRAPSSSHGRRQQVEQGHPRGWVACADGTPCVKGAAATVSQGEERTHPWGEGQGVLHTRCRRDEVCTPYRDRAADASMQLRQCMCGGVGTRAPVSAWGLGANQTKPLVSCRARFTHRRSMLHVIQWTVCGPALAVGVRCCHSMGPMPVYVP